MSADNSFDEVLLARLRAQDPVAFSLLVKRYHLRLKAFAGSLASDLHAEDVLQEAWVSIWRGLPNFAGRSSLNTWLYTIVRNECFARLRKEGRISTVQQDIGDDKGFEEWVDGHFQDDGHWNQALAEWSLNTPEAMLEEQQLIDCLDHHIDILQCDQQAVFRLRELEQIELEEICNILSLSHSNVRVLLHRARHRLLQVVDHYQETGEC